MRSRFLALFVTLVCINDFSASRAEKPDILRYLPDMSGITGWTTLGEPQVAGGEDLYLLINGAAELYMEYGFEQALFQSYGSKNEKTINLEIYKMSDPHAAYGMYTFRTSKKGKAIPIGSGASIEDYYLNLWKGSFFVTVIGFDTEEETINGITTIAEAVAARIVEKGQAPDLAKLLLAEGLENVKYLRGNLALFNNYEFDKANIFGVSEGVIGLYRDHRVFLFSYGDDTESGKWLANGIEILESSPRFDDFTQDGNGYTMTGKKDEYIHIEGCRSYIIIMLGSEEKIKEIMLEQISHIEQSE
jgi:hypothetical protein